MTTDRLNEDQKTSSPPAQPHDRLPLPAKRGREILLRPGTVFLGPERRDRRGRAQGMRHRPRAGRRMGRARRC